MEFVKKHKVLFKNLRIFLEMFVVGALFTYFFDKIYSAIIFAIIIALMLLSLVSMKILGDGNLFKIATEKCTISYKSWTIGFILNTVGYILGACLALIMHRL